ncbi:MAG: response regulator [Desulfobacula sp.]|jgi:CheY-like chemotaxis protein
MNPGTIKPILIIEDSTEDYMVILRIFQRLNLPNPVFHFEDGDEALNFLFHPDGGKPYGKPPLPGFILLDLNLPGTDGREVLMRIKTDEQLKTIPVVVLTTSNDPDDIQYCYAAGANCYMHKPVNLKDFKKALQALVSFWFENACLPAPAAQ